MGVAVLHWVDSVLGVCGEAAFHVVGEENGELAEWTYAGCCCLDFVARPLFSFLYESVYPSLILTYLC